MFSVAFWLFFFLGLFGCLVMFFGANQIAQWYGSPESNYAIMALAPTLFFISIESSIRGYFQGRSNMVPTATSQTIEAVTKVIIGVGLAFYIIQNFEVDRTAGPPWGPLWASPSARAWGPSTCWGASSSRAAGTAAAAWGRRSLSPPGSRR